MSIAPSDRPADPSGDPQGHAPVGVRPVTRRPGRLSRIRRGRHAKRRIAITALIALAAFVFLTRSALVRWVVEPRLSAMMGGEATMASASVTLRGTLSLRDVRVTAPGAPAQAATVLEARRIDLAIAPVSLFTGSPRITRIGLVEPTVRVSQAEDGWLTVQGLTPKASGAAPAALPIIEITRGAVEVGEHTATEYRRLARLPVSGRVEPSARNDRVYTVRLQGLPDESRIVDLGRAFGVPAPTPTVLEGEIGVESRTARLRLTNIDLASWGSQWAPSALRDRWTALEIEGRLPRTEFAFTPEEGASAEVTLEDVALTLPVAPTTEQTEGTIEPHPPRNLRMASVSGTVRFDRSSLRAALTGLIEDLKYRVVLTTDGLALTAPFRLEVETAEPFTVGAHPSLLPFAPPVVRERFQTFSGPTAVVEGQVVITRGPVGEDGVPPEPSVAGALRFHDGAAAYERFPYPIFNLAGLVRFTDKEIRIESITGSNRSGARLHAEGIIAPPTDGAEVDLRIAVVDLPLDDELEEAMPEARKGLVGALFDGGAYARRVAAGLLQSTAAKAEAEASLAEKRTLAAVRASRDELPDAALDAEIADLERRVRIPVFDLGARAQLDIRVHRAAGKGDGNWSSEVRAGLPRAGLFPREFPYPCVVEGGEVWFDDYEARAEFTTATGPTGGEWSFIADATLMNERDEKMFRPRIIAIGRDVPIDALLLEALPVGRSTGSDAAEAQTIRAPDANAPHDIPATLGALGLSGRVDCQALIEPREGDDSPTPTLGFDAHVALRDVSASPPGSGGAPILSSVFGEAEVTERSVRAESLNGRFAGGSLSADVRADFPGSEKGVAPRAEVRATASVRGLDLESPIETLVSLFDPRAGDRIAALRAEHAPAGRIDASLEIESAPTVATEGAPGFEAAPGPVPGVLPEYRVSLSNPRWIALTIGGGRLEAPEASGAIRLTPDRLEFEGVAADTTCDGESSGRLSLDGAIALAEETQTVHASLRDGRFESPIVRGLLAAVSAGQAETKPAESKAGAADEPFVRLDTLRGVFDAELTLGTAEGAEPRIEGTVSPRSLALERGGVALDFDRVEGRVVFDGEGGALEGLRAEGRGLWLAADGAWTTKPTFDLDVRVRGEAESLESRALALLPAEALNAARALKIEAKGPIALDNAEISVSTCAEGAREIAVSGAVRFSDASANVGVSVAHANGSLRFDASEPAPSPGGAAPDTRFSVALDIASALVAGLSVTGAEADVRSGEAPGEILAPVFSCSTHGGRLAGWARVDGEGDDRAFEVDLVASGVALGEALRELQRDAGAASAPPSPPPTDPAPDRGLLDASLSMRGRLNDAATRSGRGRFQVDGGELVAMPVVTQLIELSNLAPPMGGRLRETDAEFHIEGALVTFDQLRISSSSISLLGQGALRYPELDVDMRFTSRGNVRIPLLSDVFEGLRDEIVTITVTGPLADPQFGTTSLAGTRAIMGDIFRPDPGKAREQPATPVERHGEDTDE